ncbi:hypothetical protein ACFFX0_27070 [Citricoccus parietis]|uniref:Uncharacterized protein n=1 Tax=Citricoccus parietis TaxID=592307 RepID=A0ABV5G6R7_9MICC
MGEVDGQHGDQGQDHHGGCCGGPSADGHGVSLAWFRVLVAALLSYWWVLVTSAVGGR